VASKKWIGASGGAWALAANWSPAGGAATSLDDATLTGPSGASYQAVSGPGSSASLTLLGNTTLSGVFNTGALSVGTPTGPGALTIAAGSTVKASTAALGGVDLVSGAGAKLIVSGALTLGGTYPFSFSDSLTVAAGASVQVGSVTGNTIGDDSISVDATSAFEVGTAGGAAAGKVTIDAGAVLSASAFIGISAAGGIANSGTILVKGGYLSLGGPVVGTGTLQIGAAGTLSLSGANNEAITFNDSSGTLGLSATANFNGSSASTYTLSETGVISGLVEGDTIAVNSFSLAVTGATYQAGAAGTGTLTLTNGATSLGTLTLAGDYTGKGFQVTPDSFSGKYNITLVTVPTGGGTLSPGTKAPDAYNWTSTDGGNWGSAANWTDTTTGAAPAAIAPGINDLVTLTGRTGTSYQVVAGPGNSASLTLLGNTTLTGAFNTGALRVGAGTGAGALYIAAGGTVAASTATLISPALVSGAGAKLTVSGALRLGGANNYSSRETLAAAAGATIQADSVVMLPLAYTNNTITVDAASTFEVGAAGGAVAGNLTVDAGHVLSGAGSLNPWGNIANAGTILAQGGSLQLNGSVTGTGTLQIGAGGTLYLPEFAGTNSEAIAFNDNSGTLGLSVSAVFHGLGATTYALFEGGVISGFVQGDTIALNSYALPLTGVTYQAGKAGTGTLTLTSGATLLGTLALAGNYAGKSFQVTPGPYNADYNVTLAPAKPPQASLFDANFYLSRNPDVAAAGVDPYQHYLAYGWKEGRDPSALFSDSYYLSQNPDVAAAGVNPLLHYEQHGWQEGRNPDALFDTNYYLAQNPDVAAAGVDPLLHFQASGAQEGRDPSLVFSDAKYLAANPDVAAAGLDPLAHYLAYGQSEGRMAFLSGGTAVADPLVDAAYYDKQLGATLIPTDAAGQGQAAASYDATGWQKGLNPDAFFDTSYYLSHNPDVAAAHLDPLQHYEQHGWTEGRDPSAQFSTAKYLAAYSDVKAAGVDPLLHYVEYGKGEGRAAFAA